MAYDVIMGDMKKFRKRRPDESLSDFINDFLTTHFFLSLFLQVCFSGLCFGIAFLIEKTIATGLGTLCILILSGIILITLIVHKIFRQLFPNSLEDWRPPVIFIGGNICIIFGIVVAIVT